MLPEDRARLGYGACGWLLGHAMEEDSINTCCGSLLFGFLCRSLEPRTVMEVPEVPSLLSVSALSLLLVPVVMGWMFLALRVTW